MTGAGEVEAFEVRLQRILSVIGAATRGDYEPRVPVLERDDDFIELEVAVNMLLDELVLLRRENETQRQEIETKTLSLADRDRALLRAMSTPIITVWPEVIALPLIGKIDEERQAAIAEILLARVSTGGATHIILDVTGVHDADSAMVNALVSTARAVRLLGATTIITGVTPAVARAMVDIDERVDVPTMAKLSDALSWVFRDKQSQKSSRRFSARKTAE